MQILQATTSEGTSIQDIFLSKIIKKSISDDKPRRSSVTFEFDDGSCVHVWFEVINLDGWQVTGALRIVENALKSDSRGICRDVGPANGILISGISLLCTEDRWDGVDVQIANGLVLSGSKGESVTMVSSPMAGAMDFGVDVALESLETEYSADSYHLRPIT